jgi:hypothetical protein
MQQLWQVVQAQASAAAKPKASGAVGGESPYETTYAAQFKRTPGAQ